MFKKILSHTLSGLFFTGLCFAVLFYYLSLKTSPVSEEELAKRKDSFNGQVVVITGSSGGIGFALAKAANRLKMKLVLADIYPEKSFELAKKVRESGGYAVALKADLRDPRDRSRIVETAVEHFGTVDMLINNAGYLYLAKPEEMELSEVKKVFEVHLFACIDLVKKALPFLKRRKSSNIVNIGSILAHYPTISGMGQKGLNSIYTASKAALFSWSQVIREALRAEGVNVVFVSPAGTKTGFWRNAVGPSRDQAIKESNSSWSFYDEPKTIAADVFDGVAMGKNLIFPGHAWPISRLLEKNRDTDSHLSKKF